MKESSLPVIVGIDVSKDNLDVYFNSENQHQRIPYKEDALHNLANRITKMNQPTLVVMEATGGYEKKLVRCLQSHGIKCAVVNPKQLRDFARGCGKIEKNDAIDSKVIAFFGEVNQPKPLANTDENREKLKSLTSRRDQVQSLITQESNRLQQTDDQEIRKFIQQAIDLYKNQLKELDKQILNRIEADPAMSQKATILQSVKGIGPATTANLIAGLPELGSLNRQQIAKLVGLAPIVRDSGKFKGRRRICAGRSHIRRALYMATLVATRWNERIKQFYQSLLANGKPKKLALTACMRKLLTILNSMIKNNQSWKENQPTT